MMVSHDTFKNILLFSLVGLFLFFLFRDKILILTENMSSLNQKNDVVNNQPKNVNKNIVKNNDLLDTSGQMTYENTGIDRSMILSDDEIGILSTCRDNKGELIENCSPVENYNYEYDSYYDQFLRNPTNNTTLNMKSKQL